MRGRTAALCALVTMAAGLAGPVPGASADPRAASPATPATSGPGRDCEQVLPGVRRGDAAVEQLGAALPQAAARAGMSTERFRRTLRRDHSFRVDRCGRTFVVDDALPADEASEAPGAQQSLSTTGDAFALSSRPGAPRTIYLDFDGATISGTAWNSSYNGGAAWQAPAFSADADAATFSAAEQAVVKDVWLRVAEDYAPFDIDVTTAVPDPAALARSSGSDQVYGATALITNDSVAYGQCGCGGIAYVGVFDQAGSTHEYYQPALVFQRGLGTGAKALAEAASHELGHNLGLSHDGTASVGYYAGQGSWAPIMGVGYSKPVTQFSSGEYPGANNTEDDIAVMGSNGANPLADEHGGTDATATTLTTAAAVDGLIGTRGDTDRFTFAAAGATSVTVTPQAVGANLDTRLEIRDSGGSVIATADPAVTTVNSSTAGGLAATVSFTATAGTYTATVDGTGWGDPAATGYSDYASLGRYVISLTTSAPDPVTVTTAALPMGTVGVAYSATLAASGGTPPYTWQLASGSLPSGVSLAPDGTLSGTPATAGSTTARFAVTDGAAKSATSTALTITIDPAPATPVTVTTAGLPGGTVGTPYSATLAATGGTPPYMWSGQSGSLPAGLALSGSGTISGTPTVAGSVTVRFTATDGAAGSGTSPPLTITVDPAPATPVTVTTASLPGGTVGTPYSATLAATGGTPPYTWSVQSGSLPAGLVLRADGLVSGTPTAAATSTVTVRAADGNAASGTRTLTITVASPVTVTTNALPVAYRGVSYSARLSAMGGTAPYTWRLTAGSLPGGLRMSTAGVVSGRPTSIQTRSVTVRTTDARGLTAARSLSITVLRPVTVTAAAPPAGLRGSWYEAGMTASGGTAPYTWRVASGALPAGLTLTAAGMIRGTPSAAHTRTFTLRVTDRRGQTASRVFTIRVAAPLVVTTAVLPTAHRGKPYLRRLRVAGATGAAQWRLVAGALPKGLRLRATGVVQGRPKVAQTRRFTVRCTDATGRFAARAFAIVVRP